MAAEGDTRYRLHQALVPLMGAEMATALVENLPPEGWGDVLRQPDLAQFEQRMDLRFQAVEGRMDLRFEAMAQRVEASEQRLRAELHRELHREIVGVHQEIGLLRQEFSVQTRSLLLAVSGLMVTICTVVFGAAKLL